MNELVSMDYCPNQPMVPFNPTWHFQIPGHNQAVPQVPFSHIPPIWYTLADMCGITLTGKHYNDVILSLIASQITSLTNVYSTVYSDADQRKHQSTASLAFVRGIHRGPVNSPHKWPVTRKMFPFDDVIMNFHAVKDYSQDCCSFWSQHQHEW